MLDAQGNPLIATNPDAVRALDHAIAGYARARRDTRDRLGAVLAADPRCAMAHLLDGYLYMLASKREAVPLARAALDRARAALEGAPAATREVMHAAALDAWSGGDMRLAAARWDTILAEHPRDLVALKVSQFVLSYLGESLRMRNTVARVLPAWSEDRPGYGLVLGCYAYALEESGDYVRAEETGRRAVELDPGDIWAAHAVAHVAEMQGRLRDGIAWIGGLVAEWAGCSNFANHLRWHEGLYHLELDDHAQVLAIYDREVRAEPSDEYLDVTNAVSLLWRLEQADVDVGARWEELADRAAARVDDHALVFVDLHYAMALAAAGDTAAAEELIDSCTRFAAEQQSTEATVMRAVGIPVAEGILAHRRGSYGDAVDHIYPVRKEIRLVGGSHAQRDLFDQLLIDSAWRGNRLDVANELLAERVAARPENRWGLKHHAAVLERRGTLGAARAADVRRELDRLRAL
jgi:tetratricopeptide (TPR) repeat protein